MKSLTGVNPEAKGRREFDDEWIRVSWERRFTVSVTGVQRLSITNWPHREICKDALTLEVGYRMDDGCPNFIVADQTTWSTRWGNRVRNQADREILKPACKFFSISLVVPYLSVKSC